ncbi:MAG: membrane dipeptidase, partial [Acidisphaera sp.]|nr:membrane dipeptidase [Acidisphaera sp.]
MRSDPERTLSWDDLARGRALSRASVRLEGFLHPLDVGELHETLVLGPEPPCCVGCFPRDPRRAVELYPRAAVALTGGAVRVRGTLLVQDGNDGGFRYRIDDAVVEPAPARAAAFPRRALLAAGPLLCAAARLPRAFAQSDDGRDLIADAATVDMHSHAGGLSGVRTVEEDRPFTPVAEPMRRGGMAVSCLAIVSDGPTHRVGPDHRIRPFRDPEPGELYAYGNRSFARLHALIAAQSLGVIATADELRAARSDRPSAIVSAEGADFLEGQLDRVDEAYARWTLRHLQLTHYRPNELGDI